MNVTCTSSGAVYEAWIRRNPAWLQPLWGAGRSAVQGKSVCKMNKGQIEAVLPNVTFRVTLKIRTAREPSLSSTLPLFAVPMTEGSGFCLLLLSSGCSFSQDLKENAQCKPCWLLWKAVSSLAIVQQSSGYLTLHSREVKWMSAPLKAQLPTALRMEPVPLRRVQEVLLQSH